MVDSRITGFIAKNAKLKKLLHILLIGNNPIELGGLLAKISRGWGESVKFEIAFDAKTAFERLLHFCPHYILIDDNLGKNQMSETVQAFSTHPKTKNIPITVLKNSNYHEANGAWNVLDYILKKNLTPESLYVGIQNSTKLRRTQRYLQRVYKRRKRLLQGLFGL